MAINFPTPTVVGQTFTDPVSGSVYVCTVVGPPATWVGSGSTTNLDGEYLRLDSSNDPVNNGLDVVGDLSASTGTFSGIITTGSYDRTSTTAAGSQIGAGGTFSSQRIPANASTGVAFQAYSGTDQTVTIMNDGTTSIGGTLPSNPNITLNANGTAVFESTVTVNSTGTALAVYRKTTNAGSNNIAQFYSDIGGTKTLKAEIRSNGSVVANGTTLTSDQRLKTNIVDAANQWGDVSKLQLRSYEWTADPGEKMIGLVAQEVEKVCPLMVDKNSETDTLSIKFDPLVYKMLGALQEAQTRIEALEAEVAALKGA